MAKAVRIEPEVWGDTRFKFLGEFSGVDRFSAIARLALVWSHCTERKTYNLFPEEIDAIAELQGFASHLLHSLILLGEKLDDGRIHLIGTKGRIEWYAKLEKAARKGGQKRSRDAKRNKDGSFSSKKPSSPPPATTQPSPGSGSPAQPSVPSPSLVPVNPSSLRKKGDSDESPTSKDLVRIYSEIESTNSNGGIPAAIDNPVGFFIGRYVKAYEKRYGAKARPDLRGKIQGQIKAFLSDGSMSLQRACDLIQIYCQMDDAWFKTKHHDFVTFLENLSKVQVAFASGSEGASVDAHLAKARELDNDKK